MDVSSFGAALEREGMHVSGRAAFGIAEGYPVLAVLTGGHQVRVTLPIRPQEWRARKSEIKGALGNLGRAIWEGDRLSVSIKVSQPQEVYSRAVAGMARTFRDLGIALEDTCPICGHGGCDMAVPYERAYRPAHRVCVESTVAGIRESVEDNRRNGSYLSGIAGAILGGILGVAPSFLTIVYTDTVFGLLFAFIPLFAYYGYKLFRGKMNKTALACSIAMSVLGVYILNFSAIGYVLRREYSLTFGQVLQVMPAFLEDPEVWWEITKSSISQFIFAAVGVFLVWGDISRTAAGEAANAENVLAASMPLRPGNVRDGERSTGREEDSGE